MTVKIIVGGWVVLFFETQCILTSAIDLHDEFTATLFRLHDR